MMKGVIRLIAIVSAAGLALALASGPGPAGSGTTVRERSRAQVQTQAQVQVQTRDPGACDVQAQVRTQMQEQVRQRAMLGSITRVDGASALQSELPGKGDVLRTRDRLQDGSCQLEDATSVFATVIEYDHDYDHSYDHTLDYDYGYDYLHDGPPPDGGYGGHGS